MDIGKRVRDAREARELTQEELARRAGVPLNRVGRIETGAVTDPHYSTLSRIADGLGLSVGELLEEALEAGPPDTRETIIGTVLDLVLKQDRREAQALNRLSESQQPQESFGHDDHEAMMYLLELPRGAVEEAFIDLTRKHAQEISALQRCVEELEQQKTRDTPPTGPARRVSFSVEPTWAEQAADPTKGA